MVARPDDIVAYTYRAGVYCPSCVVSALPTEEGGDFDGWAVAEGVQMSTEENLSEIAAAFGIDRMNEHTYDSDNFPKVIFRDMAEDERCDHCGEVIE